MITPACIFVFWMSERSPERSPRVLPPGELTERKAPRHARARQHTELVCAGAVNKVARNLLLSCRFCRGRALIASDVHVPEVPNITFSSLGDCSCFPLCNSLSKLNHMRERPRVPMRGSGLVLPVAIFCTYELPSICVFLSPRSVATSAK